MGDYYIAGGSKYDAPDCTVWVYCDLNGYDPTGYGNRPISTYGEQQDPYWRLGGTGGQKMFEMGLWDDNRIKVENTGYFYWDKTATGYKNLLVARYG